MTYQKSTAFSRRSLLAAAGLALLPRPTRADTRPNVVVVVLDDMRAEDWQALPKTRQALGGTMYRNYFICNPLCGPSRASLFTGQHSHRHGIHSHANAGPNMVSSGIVNRALNVPLHDAGYFTAMVGKYNNDLNTNQVLPGWDRFISLWQGYPFYTDYRLNEHGRVRHYEVPETKAKPKKPKRWRRDREKRKQQRAAWKRKRKAWKQSRKRANSRYLTNKLRSKAVSILRGAPKDRPFFLYYAPFAPHSPAIPAERDERKYRKAKRERTPAFLEKDVSDKPAYIRNERRRSARYYDDAHANRLRSLASVDASIAALAETVKARGQWNDTYWFVVSDNGYCLGEHGWERKNVPYDASVRVPALISGPGVGRGASNQFIANIDLAPTICQLAGVSMPDVVDGEDIFTTTRDAILVESQAIGYQGVRTKDHLYVEYDTGERELYDYRSDLHELDNQLATWLGEPTADPAVVDDLAARLNQLRN